MIFSLFLPFYLLALMPINDILRICARLLIDGVVTFQFSCLSLISFHSVELYCYFCPVIMKTGGWFYKDRLGRSRGPMELVQLRTAWTGGIIDRHTFIWGEDMDEWAPISMVYGLERAIATWDGLFSPTCVFYNFFGY